MEGQSCGKNPVRRSTAREWIPRRKSTAGAQGEEQKGFTEGVWLDLGFGVWGGFRKASRGGEPREVKALRQE